MAEVENHNESQQQESSLQVAAANAELISFSEDNESFYLEEHKEALSNIEEAQVESADLRIEVDEKGEQLSALSEADSQIKELAGQLSGAKVELEYLSSKKRELESQVQSQATEAQQLRDQNMKLNTWVLELEEVSEKSRSETAEAMSQSSDLQQEMVSLQVQNSYLEQSIECIRNEASARVHDLTEQLNVMQQQLESKTKQVSENLVQIETLKEELARSEVEKKEELRDLELERIEVEQQVRSKDHETIQLRDEKEELHARIFELEGVVIAKEKDLSLLQNKAGSVDKQEVNKSEKIPDQPRNTKEAIESTKPESARSLISENINKFNKFSDQAKESGDKINPSRSLISINNGKFNKNVKESEESTKKVTTKDLNSKSCQSAQRKMDDLAAEFRKHVEDKIRLLSQRIRVLEQLHAENTSSHKIMHDTLEHENKLLQAKVTSYEAELNKLKSLYETAKTTMKGLEFMVCKLEAGNKDLDRMANLVNELELAKKWIQLKTEYIRQLGYGLDSVNAQLEEKQEKIETLEAKVSQLEHEVEERDEEVRYLGEEKREVIRQLCVLIDHLREENQDLKEIIAKLRATKSLAKH